MSDAQSKATIKYVKKNYDRVEVRFRKEEEIPKKIKIHCEKYNYRDEYNRPNKSMLFKSRCFSGSSATFLVLAKATYPSKASATLWHWVSTRALSQRTATA